MHASSKELQPLYVQEQVPAFLASEDPVERLSRGGPENLRTCELLALVLDIETPAAAKLLAKMGVVDLVRQPFSELVHRFAPNQAGRLVACAELGRRISDKGLRGRPVVNCPSDVVSVLSDIRDEQREHFLCLCLNARHQLIHKEVVSIGSLSATIVHPREVFQMAIEHSAASLILAHNHPSGEVSPSRDDIDLTGRLVQAGAIMGIDILDHIIISADGFLSLKEEGLM